jgi:hypothetical protein
MARNKRTPRIHRGSAPKGVRLTSWNLRKKMLPHLLEVFGYRCAYSQRHDLVTGKSCLDIEHFNPKLTGAARNRYSNLMLGAHLTNSVKTNTWPTLRQRRKGIRFLNPCKEQDYGVHLFEDPVTHRIVSSTPAGRFHIVACNLNDESYVWERMTRANLRAQIPQPRILPMPPVEISQLASEVSRLVEVMIPPIPPPTADVKPVAE